MKIQLLSIAVCLISLQAQSITLTPEQEANWQIKHESPKLSERLPLGDFIAQVVTPPTLLHTISLPFEANVKQLNVAQYQEVKKGDVLAKVTGTEWISIQQKAIAEAIEYKHHSHLTERKNMLCKEEIIPQKECMAANAELEADKIRVAASKALLKSYGANSLMIEKLFTSLTLSPATEVKSSVNGRIVSLGATPGKSTSPSDALFVIQEKGSLWLESDIEAKRTKALKEGQKVRIVLDDMTFDTTILQISPVINPQSQTRQVRFLIPQDVEIVAGLRGNALISFSAKSLAIAKTSVIKEGENQIIFVKNNEGYTSVAVDILAENDSYYFVKPTEAMRGKIASSSVAILKNMLGENDE
jgi:multidrug efflux pump subunit AcrA (membrane-fusion protein)